MGESVNTPTKGVDLHLGPMVLAWRACPGVPMQIGEKVEAPSCAAVLSTQDTASVAVQPCRAAEN